MISRLLEHISSKVWENCKTLKPGPELGGVDSVIELAAAKQAQKKLDHFATTSWNLAEVLTVLT